MDLKEYKNWLQANRIRRKVLAIEIGYRYDHVIQVLNGHATLTDPFQRALEMFKQIKTHEQNNKHICIVCNKPIIGSGYCSVHCADTAYDQENFDSTI